MAFLVSRGRGIVNAGLLDVQSVEVLKGPQALFFGKNSPGGVISVNSKNLGNEFETSVRAGYNFRDEQRYGGRMVSVPLSDPFSARVALRVDDSRGYIRNLRNRILIRRGRGSPSRRPTCGVAARTTCSGA